MRSIVFFFTIAMGTCFSAFSQPDSLAIKYSETIVPDDLKNHLFVLAGDEYEGRETGMKGQKMAAEYISNYFQSLGVDPVVDGSYFQSYPLVRTNNTKATLSVGSEALTYVEDFYFFSGFETAISGNEDLVFVGYGIDSEDWNDYSEVDVKDKIVVMLPGEPMSKNGNYLLTGEDKPSEWSGDFRIKREAAVKNGAKMAIMVKEEYSSYVGRIKYWLQNPGMRLDMEREEREEVLPVLFVRPDIADSWMKKAKLGSIEKYSRKINKKQKSFSKSWITSFDFDMNKSIESFTGENVLCFIEGSDPLLKNEIVVITSHYDHIGIIDGEINNGADDDGSGTVAVLEMAQAFVQAKKEGNGPRRSVLLMTVSGEEKGLLGSEWYSEHPVFPLENTVVDLNVDMIGRVDEAHADNENYIYLIGSDKLSTELHAISEEANTTYTNLELDYTYNDPKDPNRFYYRSDHYNFAKHGIPVIFYFSGVHEDYHRPTDTPEKIMYDKLSKVAQLIFFTAWELANRDDRIKVDVTNDFK
ncbi:MAG: M28 family peptidase [Flavobacteriales bacterium]|nr:M28 family peptidase [Flavobacteriales bacterium]